MEAHRHAALQILRTLRKQGHIAYFAGGCVRDELLGLTPEDYDVATDARPEQILRLYPRANEVGAAFGVMLVREHGVTVEIATFRKEWGYADARRPDHVEYSNERNDAQRRDFTINALFLDPTAEEGPLPGLPRVQGRVIDYVDGLDDLRSRVIRAVGDPELRLAEDHLRALRAVRFAARFGFEIDPRTSAAITAHAGDLRGVSRERIGEEFRRMLSASGRGRAVRLVESLGLDGPVLSDLGAAPGPDAKRILDRLDDSAGYVPALGAWAFDRTAATDQLGADSWIDPLVQQMRDALCLSNLERDRLRAALSGVSALERDWLNLPVARQKRDAASAWFDNAMVLVAARSANVAATIEYRVQALAGTSSGLRPDPLVTGDDLLALGLTGPDVGRGLDLAYDAQLEDAISTRDEALALVRQAFAGGPDSRSDTE